MKNILFAALFCIVSFSCANARIGETVNQCDDRYGQPKKKEDSARGTTNRHYKTEKAYIVCSFYKDECVKMYYQFSDPKLKDKELPLWMVRYILDINTADGDSWIKVEGRYKFVRYFLTSVTGAKAYATEETMNIKSRKYLILDKKAIKLDDYSKPCENPMEKGL